MANSALDTKALRAKFTRLKMLGAVALIDTFEKAEKQGKPFVEVGSSTIGPRVSRGLVDVHNALERKFGRRMFFFYIGVPPSRNSWAPGITPMEHMGMIGEIIDQLLVESREQFDRFCGTLAASHERMNRPSARVTRAPRQWIIAARRMLGLRISDDLLLGVRGWWNPWRKRGRKIHSLDSHIPQVRFDAPFDDPSQTPNPNNG